jgi:hypothetical protein
MSRLFLLIMAAAALGGAGCLHVQPVGPMAKMLGTDPKPGPIVPGAKPAAEPVTVPAPKPVPPAMLVTPGEVSDQNPQDAQKKLIEELEQDRRSLDAMPRPSEVSVYKGRK